MGNINIKKLAQELNLSAATVSRALRDSYEISTETKVKVWEMAKKLNYQPNPAASNLRSQKTKTIAVIIPEIANNFFSQAINGIEEIARELDYHVLIYQTHESGETELAFTQTLLNGRVDGILISIASETKDNEHFKEMIKSIPMVFFDRIYEDIDTVKITTDDHESSYKATQHLIDNGCRKIAYLKALDNLSTGKKRLSGYFEALKANGIEADHELVVAGNNSEAEGYAIIKDLLTSKKPDGIISSIEEFAFPCYYVCKDLDINIPRDVKIISFSNLKAAPLLAPPLTTITQPAFEIGKEAASMLFKLINKKYSDPYETLVLSSKLIIRESTSAL